MWQVLLFLSFFVWLLSLFVDNHKSPPSTNTTSNSSPNMNLGRRFLPVNPISKIVPKSPSKRLVDEKFTLMTYNMLSPHYMWPQVYSYVSEEYKDWKFRHNLLQKEILDVYRADIMCLQELTSYDYHQYWERTIARDFHYGSKFIAKTPPQYWTKKPNDMDGVGIFYNLNKFDFLSSSGIYLNDLLGTFDLDEIKYLQNKIVHLTDGAGKSIGEKSLMEVLKSRNQVGLFVSLKHKDTGTIFVVVNTHLYWKYDEVKITQCMVIMRKLSKIIKNLLIGEQGITYNKMKVVFAGDLNSTRDSLVIKFLRGERFNLGKLDIVNPMRPYLNRCLYDEIPDDYYVHTCYSGKLKGIFDYIWYHDSDFSLTKVLTGSDVSKELSESKQFGLPNENHPSDHIPVLAEFEIL